MYLCNAVADSCEVGQRGHDCLALQRVFICCPAARVDPGYEVLVQVMCALTRKTSQYA